MSQLGSYQDRYNYVRLERRDGILQATLQCDSGPANWSYAEPSKSSGRDFATHRPGFLRRRAANRRSNQT